MEGTMRKVRVSHLVKDEYGKWQLEEKGEAWFRREESRYGIGNCSTVSIEYLDGTVESVPIEHIRFLPASKDGK